MQGDEVMGSMPSRFDVRMVEKAGPIVGNLLGYLAGISANGGTLHAYMAVHCNIMDESKI